MPTPPTRCWTPRSRVERGAAGACSIAVIIASCLNAAAEPIRVAVVHTPEQADQARRLSAEVLAAGLTPIDATISRSDQRDISQITLAFHARSGLRVKLQGDLEWLVVAAETGSFLQGKVQRGQRSETELEMIAVEELRAQLVELSMLLPTPAVAPVGLKSGTLRAPAAPVAASTDRPQRNQPPRQPAPSIRIPKTRTKAPAECGTEAGYKRHRGLGEESCADCRRAVRAAQEDRAARHAAGVPVATRAKVAPCGTPAGYSRHRNHREDPCAACRKANNEYLQAYRTATRSEAS